MLRSIMDTACDRVDAAAEITYVHQNPVRRGWVAVPEHWRLSSAGSYLGEPGAMEIDELQL
jgi:hypothetical protein